MRRHARASLFARMAGRAPALTPMQRWCATQSAESRSVWGASVADTQDYTRSDGVAKWLYGCCGIVGGIVIVGGITRLTESGLSIVEWKPIRGIVPPITAAQWDEEFTKYQQYPEYEQRGAMSLSEFKFIFFWEWFHRVLARSMGVAFGVPLIYYTARGYFSRHKAFGLGLYGVLAMGGMQGALGWFMVRSGLDPKIKDEKRKATVSAYRLAAHLTLAFTIYVCMLRAAYALRLPSSALPTPLLRFMARGCTTVMFFTAVSGAFVAGLDAGLFYNDSFPMMGEGILPPPDDIFVYDPMWRNIFENGPAAQLWHRVMAGVTTYMIGVMDFYAYRNWALLSPLQRSAVKGVNHALLLQVGLGIATLMSYVWVPLAALHQANSMALLTMLVRLCATLKPKPRMVL